MRHYMQNFNWSQRGYCQTRR